MKLKITLLLLILSTAVFGQKYTISGFIKDAQSSEELLYSSVLVKEISKGFATNQYGFYSITLPKGSYTFVFSYAGYLSETKQIMLDKSTNLDVFLEASDQVLGQVVVTGENSDKNVKSSEVSTINLDMKETKLLPILFGEQDVLKTIQLMPGVSASSEGNSGFYVRGGDSDQNLILLDEAPVYNASHLLGFFSVFNSDAISDIKMYKGGIPTKYGGRLSSVTDIRTKNGNMQRWNASGGLGIISSRLTVEGPIVKNKSSVIASGRRTYADIFVKRVKKEKFGDLKLYFYDLNLKANYSISRNDRIFISGYLGRDIFGLSTFGFDWGNKAATLRWNHIFNDKLFMNTSAIYSNFDYGFQAKFAGNLFGFSSGIEDANLKQDFTWFLNTKNSIKFGWQSIYHDFKPMSFNMLETNPDDTLYIFKDTSLVGQQALESSIYISNEQKIGNKITLLYGLRANLFNNIGPYETRTYNENDEIISSEKHKKYEFYHSFFTVEPRLNATFLLNEKTSLKTSFNYTVQHLHLLSNSTASSPTDIWLPSSKLVPPQKGLQAALGFFRNLLDNKIEISVVEFYRKLDNQVDFEDGAQFFFNQDIEAEVIIGEGRAYGSEFLIRKKTGNLTGWISYTLLKSERRFEEVDNNQWFSARQDRRHDFAIVASYRVLPRLVLSTSWVYNTGDAVTFPVGKYYIDGVLVSLYSKRNADRMPDYHRLDFGITWTISDNKKFQSDINLSAYNLYNRKNAYTISFSQNEQGQTQAERLSLFGIVPSISWNFRFK